jgi:hypothetical protein
VDRLTNGDALARARVHPMDLYLALKAYSSGRSQPARQRRLGSQSVPVHASKVTPRTSLRELPGVPFLWGVDPA